MTAVKGLALPINPATAIEYNIADAPFKVTKVRQASTATQVPIATIIVANPADQGKSVLFADMFLNGLKNEQAIRLIGNEYIGDVELGSPVPVLDSKTNEPVFTQTGAAVVSRRARLTSAPRLTHQAVNHAAELIPA